MRTQQQGNPWTVLLLGAALVVVAAGTAVAAGEVATMNAFGSGVSWSSLAPEQAVTLRVAGPAGVTTRHFAAGRSPSFELTDAAGNVLPDGTYNWEFVAIPRARTAARYGDEAGRGSGDAAAARQALRPHRQVVSGVFTVRGGLVVDPNLEEPVARRAAAGEER